MFDFSLSSTETELGLNRLWAVSQPRLALASLLSPLSSPAQPSHHHSQFSGGRCKILFHLLIPQMRPHSVPIQVCVWSEICDVCSMCVCVCVWMGVVCLYLCTVYICTVAHCRYHLFCSGLVTPRFLPLLPPTSCYWLLRILSPHTSLSIVSLFLLLPHIPLHCRMSHYCTRYEHLTRNPFLLVYKVNLCCRFKSVQIETIALLWGEAQLCLPYVCLKKDK